MENCHDMPGMHMRMNGMIIGDFSLHFVLKSVWKRCLSFSLYNMYINVNPENNDYRIDRFVKNKTHTHTQTKRKTDNK